MSSNFIAEGVAQSNSDMLQRVIGNTFIVEYGIIKATPAEGIVTVEMSVAESKEDVIITDCVLANIASSSVAVNIKPNVGDKVLVLFPRKYHNDMFNVQKDETIIYKQGTGYSILSGIALLVNQFNPDSFKNSLDVSDGKLTLKLAYNEDEDKNLFTVTSNENGEVSLQSNNNSVSIDKDGQLSLKLAYDSDNEKNLFTETVDKNGAFSLVSNKNSVSIDKDGQLNLNLAYDSSQNKNLLTVTTDKNGNVTVKSNGAEITVFKADKNSIKKGISIKDENGCTIKMESTGVNINGKLLIKKGNV